MWKIPRFFLILISVFLSCQQTIVEPYSWWALSEKSVKLKSLFSIQSLDVSPKLYWFRLDEERIDFFKKLDKAIDNTSATYYSGPQLSLISMLYPEMIPIHTECLLAWWDLCPDDYVSRDIEKLRLSSPEYIFWIENPEFVVAGHEANFRSSVGNSALRSMSRYIQSLLTDGTYNLVLNVELSSYSNSKPSDRATLIILKRK